MTRFVANTLPLILLTIALIGAIAFVVLYHKEARWKSSPLGIHMMNFGLMIVLVLSLGLIRSIWPNLSWFPYLRIVAYTLMAGLIWQRVFLLAMSLRRDRINANERVHGSKDRTGP